MLIDFNSEFFYSHALRFAKKLEQQFSHVFIFGNMFPESHGFVAVPVTSWNNFAFIY